MGRIGAPAGAGGGGADGVVGGVVFTCGFARPSAARGVIPTLEFTGHSDGLSFASYVFGDVFSELFRDASRRGHYGGPRGDIRAEIPGPTGPFFGGLVPVSEAKRAPAGARARLFPPGQVRRAPASQKSRKNSRGSYDKPIDGKRGESHPLWSL